MGGTDDPDNLVRVTLEEHANLHLALYLEHGHWEDWVAAMTLSGQTGFSMEGYKHSDETRAIMGYDWTEEQRQAKSEQMRGKKRGRYEAWGTDEERRQRRLKRNREATRRWRAKQ